MFPLKRTSSISNLFYGFFGGEENIAKMIIQGKVSGTTKEPQKVKYERKQSVRERMCKGIPLSTDTIKQTQLSVKNQNFKTLNINLILWRQLLL